MAADYSRRLPLLAVGVPTLIAVASAAWLLAALPTLPAEVTVHWSVTGVPDKTAPAALALIALPASIGFGLLVWSVLRRPANVRGATAPRILTAAAVLFATVVSGGVTSTLIVAARSGGAFPWLLLAGTFVLGAVLGALPALLLPAPPVTGPRESVAVAPLPLSGSERVVWVGRAAPSAVVTGVLLVVAGLIAALAVLLAVFVTPVLLVLLIPALAAAAGSSGWRVRLDEHGALIRGALPPMVLRVALADLAAARVTTVAPVGDFGGWGARYRHGVTGIVTRAGEALELERTDGHRLLVTMEHAAEAAAVLTALLARAHGTVPHVG
ncbi:MAG TPA: DUF1648 domain-containing protein [Amnibacterium sp.]|jgi:uncharacterized membrane protein|uniref:DUF1648 domain-containing protein n=1 Tax=Amnibacterium sp. TaxID=1872496 RepID=UPI002F93B9DC